MQCYDITLYIKAKIFLLSLLYLVSASFQAYAYLVVGALPLHLTHFSPSIKTLPNTFAHPNFLYISYVTFLFDESFF